MSAFKRLKKSDVSTNPYIANKQWTFQNEQLASNGIYVYSGSHQSGRFDLLNDPSNGGQYARLLFDSVNHLYYHQFSGSYLNPDSLQSSFFYESASIYRPSGSYYDYFPKYSFVKNFPTGSNTSIKIISIPTDIYGLGVKPGTFTMTQVTSTKYSFTDDSLGNIVNNSTTYVGNIFYEHGIIVITDPSVVSLIDDSIILNFKNKHIIFEKQIKCSVKDYEFNYSYNPTLLVSGSITQLKNFSISASFDPYITSVGLYNDSNDLIAIGKFSQPIPMPSRTDFTVIIKLDF